MRLVLHDAEGWEGLRDEWDRLAAGRAPSPFLTHGWLSAWWRAFGRGERVVAALHDGDGRLAAGAVLGRTRLGLTAAANDHSGDWGAVARDADVRRALWRALAARRGGVLALAHLRDGAEDARAALAAAGRRVHVSTDHDSPFLALPASMDELLAARSRNLRSQVRRAHRALEREGTLELRTTTGGDRLRDDLGAFLAVEGSGWKTHAGTSILREPGAEGLYREWAAAMAERGWLRLHLLELDGRVLAGDLGCVMGDQAFLVKTGFDPEEAPRSPGLVLRAAVIRHLIEEEGVRGYDLLGGPDAYKLRWTDVLRPRHTVRGFAGAVGVAPEAWRRAVRPGLARLRRELEARRARA